METKDSVGIVERVKGAVDSILHREVPEKRTPRTTDAEEEIDASLEESAHDEDDPQGNW